MFISRDFVSDILRVCAIWSLYGTSGHKALEKTGASLKNFICLAQGNAERTSNKDWDIYTTKAASLQQLVWGL